MYLVPSPESASMHPAPALWVATTIIDELHHLAIECRKAAAEERGRTNRRGVEAARSLEQAGNTCDHLVELISLEYLNGASRRR
jgi:hypothetical protein